MPETGSLARRGSLRWPLTLPLGVGGRVQMRDGSESRRPMRPPPGRAPLLEYTSARSLSLVVEFVGVDVVVCVAPLSYS